MRFASSITATLVLISTCQLKAQEYQIRLSVSYRNVAQEWFEDVGGIEKKDNMVVLPEVTAHSGEETKVELLRYAKVANQSTSESAKSYGLRVALTPYASLDKGISLSGTCMFRRITEKDAEGNARQFASQEILISDKIKADTPTAFPLKGGGEMIITATYLSSTGVPIKR
jgi:hypothetical protein